MIAPPSPPFRSRITTLPCVNSMKLATFYVRTHPDEQGFFFSENLKSYNGEFSYRLCEKHDVRNTLIHMIVLHKDVCVYCV